MRQLHDFVADLLPQIPTNEEAQIVLNGQNCPRAPEGLETDRLKILTHPLGRSYGDSARYDLLDFFADKETYRALGLWIFSAVLPTDSNCALTVRHADTTVKRLIVECEISKPSSPRPGELVLVPVAYSYRPSLPEDRHPLTVWNNRRQSIVDSPFLELTNESGQCVSEQEFAARSVVRGFGTPTAAADLAALFLDLGLPDTQRRRFDLEGPSGYEATSTGSAEARFWIGYDYDPSW